MTPFPETQLRRIFRVVNGGTPTSDPENWDGDVPWATPVDLAPVNGRLLDSTNRCLTKIGLATGSSAIPGGSLLISTRAPIGYVAEISQGMAFNQGCRGLVPLRPLDVRYFRYQLLSMSDQLQSRGQGSTFVELSSDGLAVIPVRVPSLPVQGAIADYLDAETSRIDALIEKKERLLLLLEEKAFSGAVRSVLGDWGDVSGSPSPSGIYRFVPSGWQETTLRHLGCEVQTGPFGSQLHADDYVDGGWPVVNPMNIVGGTIVASQNMRISDEKRHELRRHILRPGDIVFGRRGEMGRAGLVADSQEGWLCGTGSLRLRLHQSTLMAAYLKLLLETPAARAYFELSSVGSTMDNLNSEIVLAFPTLVPPIPEQLRVIQVVERRDRLHAMTRQRLEAQIGLLAEHREALITAAVSGELEIPKVAA